MLPGMKFQIMPAGAAPALLAAPNSKGAQIMFVQGRGHGVS